MSNTAEEEYIIEKPIQAWSDNIELFENVFKPMFEEQAENAIIDVPLEEGRSLIYNLHMMDRHFQEKM